MNPYFATGAILTILIAVAHSYLGERYLVSRLLKRSNLPQLFGSDVFTKHTLRFAWHLTSVAWLGAAAILFVIGSENRTSEKVRIAHVIALTFLVSAAVSLVGSRGRHLSWVVFLAIAAATWLGAGR